MLYKKSFILLFLMVLLNSCSTSSDDDLTEIPLLADKNLTENVVQVKSGSAITKIDGDCTWETIIEDSFIFLTDKTITNRALIISLNLSEMPTETTTYTIVGDPYDEDPLHIDLTFSEYITQNNKTKLLQWNSTNESGEVTFVVDNDKISVNFNDIVLAPRLESIGFESLNVGEYAKPGVLSGNITLPSNN